MNKTKSKFTKKYILAIVFFVFSTILSIAIFIVNINTVVNNKVKEVLLNEVKGHQESLVNKIEVQFQELEGIAKYIGDLNTQDTNLITNITQSFTSDSGFDRIVVAFKDGIGYLSDGSSYDINDRLYFQEIMAGQKRSSDSVDSVIDGRRRMALSVPIYQNNQVVAMLMGSYDVATISEMEFSDIYDHSGYAYIIDADGNVVINDYFADTGTRVNFFSYAKEKEYLNDEQLDQIKDDLENGKQRSILVTNTDPERFLVYIPLGFNYWSICYSVPSDNAFQDYYFIMEYEMYLIGAITVILLVTIGYIFIQHLKERRMLLKRAEYDGLTGVYNRTKITAIVNNLMATGDALGLAILDIDDFKMINDTYGHPAGDDILKAIGEILKNDLNEEVVGRLGGDEFIILVEDVQDINQVIQKLETACQKIAQIKLVKCPSLQVTCSCGLAVAPKDGETSEELYKAADSALYIAKSLGKNKLAKF